MQTLLDAIEPDTIPNQRYNRIVHVGTADVLELCDPNDGLVPDRRHKTRHQYLRAGDRLWSRRLPPESLGDCWRGEAEPPRWEPIDVSAHSLLREAYELLPQQPVAYLQRLRLCVGGECEYSVRGAYVAATRAAAIDVPAGPVTGSWWEVPLPACPDCGGSIVWAEAGYVPGARCCVQCGSLYTVEVRQ